MRAKARIGRHPIHPMLILIPAGAFILVLLCDLGYLLLGDLMWWEATRPLLLIGIGGALVAAVPGAIDYLGLAGAHDVRKIGFAHAALNVVAVVVFALNAMWRFGLTEPPATGLHLGFGLTVLGSVLVGIGGWLGGSMVYKHGVGVVGHPGGQLPETRSERADARRAEVAADRAPGERMDRPAATAEEGQATRPRGTRPKRGRKTEPPV